MFKALTLSIIGLTLSAGAFADVELFAKYTRTECSISKGEVTRTMSFGKEKDVKFTQKTNLTLRGIEDAARKAAVVASNVAVPDSDDEYRMVVDGKSYLLNASESPEALTLIQLLVKACQIQF